MVHGKRSDEVISLMLHEGRGMLRYRCYDTDKNIWAVKGIE